MMAAFTTPDYPDMTDMVVQWKAEAAVTLLFGSGLLPLLLLAGLLIAIGNVWHGRADQHDVGLIEFVSDLLTTLIR